MAQKSQSPYAKLLKGLSKEEYTLIEVMRHYVQWNEDNDTRRTRKNGWNDVTDAYYGKLPSDWPYLNKVVDPRIRTSLLEKNARLLNQKLRGRLVPREGGDVLKSRLNNALLDFQWDNANDGGSMLEKWGVMDLDTRLYASKFALTKWKYECDEDGKVIFSGNEFKPLDIRDCGLDPTCDHIRNAKWFQHREWAKIEDLEKVNDTSTVKAGKTLYPGLKELKAKMSENLKSDRRDTRYENRILNLKGLDDRMGDDHSFPIVELVTEYRQDRWITFSPRYRVIVRDIKNPYAHRKIPVVQLRYFAIQGDPLGESEVEPVLPIWKAIQATVCGYLDNMNMHMRPPLKILDGKARIETIVYGPEAQWIIDQPDAVMEHKSNGEAMAYFQTTYQAMVAAFNSAMGDMSQGVSAVDPTNKDKTATEIKQSTQQQLTRDQKNQTSLAEALQDMMSMWLSNNKQFLFADQSMKEYILRIVGSDLFNYFQRAGLDEMEVPAEAMQAIGDIVTQQGGNMSDDDLMGLIEAGKMPKYPVITNPEEKNPEKLEYKAKMEVNDMGDGAEISLVPEDLEGNYDYIPDVRSMSTGANDQLMQGRQKAVELITSNPTILTLLQQENVKPNIKELMVSLLEDMGLKDSERFFTSLPQQDPMMMGGTPVNPQDPSGIGQVNQIIEQGNMPPQGAQQMPPQGPQPMPQMPA